MLNVVEVMLMLCVVGDVKLWVSFGIGLCELLINVGEWVVILICVGNLCIMVGVDFVVVDVMVMCGDVGIGLLLFGSGDVSVLVV